jgi:hypothetical protein
VKYWRRVAWLFRVYITSTSTCNESAGDAGAMEVIEMSNDPHKRELRNFLRKALRDAQKQRAALMEKRERDVHSVDQHSFNDISRHEVFLARQLAAAAGNPNRLDETT